MFLLKMSDHKTVHLGLLMIRLIHVYILFISVTARSVLRQLLMRSCSSVAADSASSGRAARTFDENMLENLVCPLSKQPLRFVLHINFSILLTFNSVLSNHSDRMKFIRLHHRNNIFL